MRLNKLWISSFKNLHDFRIEFDDQSQRTVLVGQNGTGKSNLIEALVNIFRNLDLDEDPPFAYNLAYSCKGHYVVVDADPTRKSGRVRFRVDEETVARKSFGRPYLPNHIFGYYSGVSDRLERYFDEHQLRFYRALLAGDERPLRPLFYARLMHSHFVLLAFFAESDRDTARFLKTYLGIQGLESVLFVLKEPDWSRGAERGTEGDPRFWYARGVVQTYLSTLYQEALAPLRMTRKVQKDFRRTEERQFLYLYVKDQTVLEKLVNHYENQQEFFKVMESTFVNELIDEVKIKVRVKGLDGSLTFQELSEGEQQLLTVLGLLRFTKDEESLFLLDEPDTHTNPAWSIRYLDLLDQALGGTKKSHVVMNTHDPLVVSGLEREEVQVLSRDEGTGKVHATIPDHDPKGMGAAGILTSELFGLRSALDLDTLGKLDRKRELAYKEVLTEEEREMLERLNEELGDLDFTRTTRDPLYEPFVRAMEQDNRYQKIKSKEVLTDNDREELQELANRILRDVGL